MPGVADERAAKYRFSIAVARERWRQEDLQFSHGAVARDRWRQESVEPSHPHPRTPPADKELAAGGHPAPGRADCKALPVVRSKGEFDTGGALL